MSEYNLLKAARPIEKFISDLSTWYLRRSRKRFKNNEEKKETSKKEEDYKKAKGRKERRKQISFLISLVIRLGLFIFRTERVSEKRMKMRPNGSFD